MWNKREETATVPDYPDDEPVTKRSILSHLGGIYDPLGIISPTLQSRAKNYTLYIGVLNIILTYLYTFILMYNRKLTYYLLRFHTAFKQLNLD